MFQRFRFIILFSLLIALRAYGQDLIPIPELSGRVVDQVDLLSPQEVRHLEQILKQLEDDKGSQIAVLIVASTKDEDIESFGIRVAEKWKLGRKDVDDGAILIVAEQDRKLRIEVGYGLEGVLTDALCKRIIANVITPEFRSGDYYKGINAGVELMITAVNGEELPPVVTKDRRVSGNKKSNNWGALAFIFAFLVPSILNAILRKFLGKGAARWITAIVVFLIVLLIAGLFLAIVISLLTLLFTGSSGTGSGGGGMYWGGFGGGGYSSGGSDFGGFSGGGGDFGGGGASGDW